MYTYLREINRYTPTPATKGGVNCELSHVPLLNINDDQNFEKDEGFDYYYYLEEGVRYDQECSDGRPCTNIVQTMLLKHVSLCSTVSQTCSERGMEFTLRTAEKFYGRIYTYKHYDKPHCFVQGNGAKVHVLKISGSRDQYSDCGTEMVRPQSPFLPAAKPAGLIGQMALFSLGGGHLLFDDLYWSNGSNTSLEIWAQ